MSPSHLHNIGPTHFNRQTARRPTAPFSLFRSIVFSGSRQNSTSTQTTSGAANAFKEVMYQQASELADKYSYSLNGLENCTDFGLLMRLRDARHHFRKLRQDIIETHVTIRDFGIITLECIRSFSGKEQEEEIDKSKQVALQRNNSLASSHQALMSLLEDLIRCTVGMNLSSVCTQPHLMNVLAQNSGTGYSNYYQTFNSTSSTSGLGLYGNAGYGSTNYGSSNFGVSGLGIPPYSTPDFGDFGGNLTYQMYISNPSWSPVSPVSGEITINLHNALSCIASAISMYKRLLTLYQALFTVMEKAKSLISSSTSEQETEAHFQTIQNDIQQALLSAQRNDEQSGAPGFVSVHSLVESPRSGIRGFFSSSSGRFGLGERD